MRPDIAEGHRKTRDTSGDDTRRTVTQMERTSQKAQHSSKKTGGSNTSEEDFTENIGIRKRRPKLKRLGKHN